MEVTYTCICIVCTCVGPRSDYVVRVNFCTCAMSPQRRPAKFHDHGYKFQISRCTAQSSRTYAMPGIRECVCGRRSWIFSRSIYVQHRPSCALRHPFQNASPHVSWADKSFRTRSVRALLAQVATFGFEELRFDF